MLCVVDNVQHHALSQSMFILVHSIQILKISFEKSDINLN